RREFCGSRQVFDEGETCQPTRDEEPLGSRRPPSQPEQRLSKPRLSGRLRSGSNDGSVWARATGFQTGFKDSLIRQLMKWPRVRSRLTSFEKSRPSQSESVGPGMIVLEQQGL